MAMHGYSSSVYPWALTKCDEESAVIQGVCHGYNSWDFSHGQKHHHNYTKEAPKLQMIKEAKEAKKQK